MKKIYFVLVLLALVTSCGSNQKSLAIHECENYSSEERKLNCYISDLRNTIRLQLEQDLRTWYQYNGAYGDWWYGDILVRVDLRPDGQIEKLKIIESSNNLRFDDFIMQSIKNASPFSMPREEMTRQKLKSFSWGIKI
ncbi:energy transducer TonB family protein [Kaarinaea lacus]